MDGEVLAGCYCWTWRRGERGGSGKGRFEDFGAALCCYCEAGGRVEAEGEGDVVAGDEAAAVGEEEEEGDGCGLVVGGLAIGRCGGCGFVCGGVGLGSEEVGRGGKEFQRVGVC